MRVIHLIDGNTVELNYMWLPTWIGQNAQFKKQLEGALREKIEGMDLTDENLDKIHDMVVEYIVANYQIPGLFEYIDGLKFVELNE
jgi:hypothetical protein